MKKLTKKLAVLGTAALLSVASVVPAFADTTTSVYGTVVSNSRIGWVQVKSRWYYYNDDNTAVRNQWVEDDGNMYWIKDNGEMAVHTWVSFNGNWFWVNAQGAAVKNEWVKTGKEDFYIGEDGVMVTNSWVNGKYYVDETGRMLRGKQVIDGVTYYFDKVNGKLVDHKLFEDGYHSGDTGLHIEEAK